ncbi:hypothetical protein Ciccas_005217 [Cichlidogyrus casuarinus]|uniref:G-protein coupled receptors family 1 profile domain-containing protein n=1 Tax=Cichlidogyrus casuarinus TaxID=1844966 RepID=A0ABD2Q995_9PLAT
MALGEYPHGFIITTVVCLIIVVFGVFSNIISFVIWVSKRQRLKNSSAKYLAALAFFDLIVNIQSIVDSVQSLCRPAVEHPDYLQALLAGAQYTGVMLIFAFTLERWIAVWYPLTKSKICSTKRGYILMVALIVISFGCAYLVYGFRDKAKLIEVGMELIFSLVVPTITLFFNMLVIYEMNKLRMKNKKMTVQGNGHSKNKSDLTERETSFVATTVMLLVLSFYNILCNLVAGILASFSLLINSPPDNLITEYEAKMNPDYRRNVIMNKLIDYCRILTWSHFSCNLLVYFFLHKSFRKQALDMIKCQKDSLLRGRSSSESLQLLSSKSNNRFRKPKFSLRPDKSSADPLTPGSVNRTRVNRTAILEGTQNLNNHTKSEEHV